MSMVSQCEKKKKIEFVTGLEQEFEECLGTEKGAVEAMMINGTDEAPGRDVRAYEHQSQRESFQKNRYMQ